MVKFYRIVKYDKYGYGYDFFYFIFLNTKNNKMAIILGGYEGQYSLENLNQLGDNLEDLFVKQIDCETEIDEYFSAPTLLECIDESIGLSEGSTTHNNDLISILKDIKEFPDKYFKYDWKKLLDKLIKEDKNVICN